jgi:hypothetical protein
MSLGFRLLKDRGVDSEGTMTEDLEHLVSHGLWIFGRMEDLVQVDSTPAQISPKLKQLVADPAVIRGDRAKDEIAACPEPCEKSKFPASSEKT